MSRASAKALPEMKPCPFCGGEAAQSMVTFLDIYCVACGARTELSNWNTRPLEDALRAAVPPDLSGEVERLRGLLVRVLDVNKSARLTEVANRLDLLCTDIREALK